MSVNENKPEPNDEADHHSSSLTHSNDSPLHPLLKWGWVIKIERFVHLEDHSQTYKAHQFDELYAGTAGSLDPSVFIRQDHRATNVFAYMDMVPESREQRATKSDGQAVLNIFKRPSIEKKFSVAGSEKPFLDHLLWIVNGDEEQYKHLLRWVTHLIFRPEKRINHGILVTGHQGTGKSLIGSAIGTLVGKSMTRVVNPSDMKSSFHHWAMDTNLVIVEELKAHGDYDMYNRCKSFFTNDSLHVNLKNLPPMDINNCLHFMMFSNYDNPIAFDHDDRRIFYVRSKVEKRDGPYYANLHNSLYKQGGIWAFAKYLREHVLPDLAEDFATLPPPKTAEHMAAADASQTELEMYVREELEANQGFFRNNKFYKWRDFREHLKRESFSVMKNFSEAQAILARLGLKRDRIIIESTKVECCWWEPFDAEMQRLRQNKSADSRRKLMDCFERLDSLF